jgi:DNA polymerase III psi subunit
MFDFLQHKTVAPHLGIRETLFGDMPIDQWLNISPQALMAEPWAYFDRANRLLIAGDKLGATDIFREILTR